MSLNSKHPKCSVNFITSADHVARRISIPLKTFSVGVIATYRHTLFDEDYDAYKDVLKSTFGDIDVAQRVEQIMTKYKAADIYNVKRNNIEALLQASESVDGMNDLEFMNKFASVLEKYIMETQQKAEDDKAISKWGYSPRADAELYLTFTENIPAQYQDEVLEQILSILIMRLDKRVKENEEYTTHQDVLNDVDPGILFEEVHRHIKRHSKAKYENKEGLNDEEKLILNITDKLLNDSRVWKSAIFMAKGLFFNAEKIRLDKASKYIEDVEDFTTDIDDNGIKKDNERAENTGREHWQIKSDTVSSFGSLSKEARSMLYRAALAEDVDDEKNMGIFGAPKIQDVALTHEKLMSFRRTSACRTGAQFIEVLKEHKNEAWVANLLYYLYDNNDNEFDVWSPGKYNNDKVATLFVAYYKNKQDYHYHNSREGSTYINTAKENYTNKVKKYKGTVYDIDRTNNKCIFNSDGSIVVEDNGTNRLGKFATDFIGYSNSGNANYYYDIKEKKFTSKFDALFKLNDKTKKPAGIGQIRDIINNIDKYFNFKMSEADKLNLENKYEFGEFLKSAIILADKIAQNARNNPVNNINDLISNKKFSYSFGHVISKTINYTTEYGAASPIEKSIRYNGSTYMTDVVPSSLGDTLERLKERALAGVKTVEDKNSEIPLLQEYIEENYLLDPTIATYDKNTNSYFIHNTIIESLYHTTKEDVDNPNSFFNQFTSGVYRNLGNENRAWEDFTEGDNYLYTFVEYLNSLNNSEEKLMAVPLFITGDSNSSRFLKVPYNADLESLNTNIFSAIVYQELARMAELKELYDTYKIQNLEDNLYKFSYFPALSDVTVTHKGNIYGVKDIIDIYSKDEKDRTADQQEILNNYKKELTIELENILQDGLNQFKEALVSAKILNRDAGNDYVWNEKVAFTAMPNTFKTKYDITENTSMLDAIVAGWYFNTKYQMIQQLQFFTIDPAYYVNTEDLQKRFKQVVASGNVFDTSHAEGQTEQKVAYIQDIKKDMRKEDPEFIKYLGTLGIDGDLYKKSSLTDGQGWRNLTSYRSLMKMAGNNRWTSAHEEVYNIIMDARNEKRDLTSEEKERIESKNVIFQPLKLHYYDFENVRVNGKTFKVPVQHKYSEIPLIPELMPNCCSKLKAMSDWMNDSNNKVDLILATSAVKVGIFGQVDIGNLNSEEDIKTALNSAYKHTFDIRGLREQNNVPEHNDIARARGTQFTKHGFMNLDTFSKEGRSIPFIAAMLDKEIHELKLTDNVSIKLDGTITGKDMMNLWNVLGSSGFIRAFNSIKRELGSQENIAKAMETLKELDDRAAKDEVLASSIGRDGNFVIAPSELTSAFDNMAALLSKFRKQVTKQRFQGGSFVQASALGMEDVLKVHIEERNGQPTITTVDCAIPFDLSYTGFNGEKVKLDYNKYVHAETGMLKDANGNPVEPGEGKSLLERDFPGMLDLIAYRIPTEKSYSLINLRVKRFLPKTCGGIIMVPTQFTTIAGFDFDIDKLYFVRREYSLEEFDDNPGIVNENWQDYYGIYYDETSKEKIKKVLKPESKEGDIMYEYLKKAKQIDIDSMQARLNNLPTELKNTTEGKLYAQAFNELMQAESAWNKAIHSKMSREERRKARTDLEWAKDKFMYASQDLDSKRADMLLTLEDDYNVYKGKSRLYQYWSEALELMKNADDERLADYLQGKTVEEVFPKTAEEAYMKFVNATAIGNGRVIWNSSYDYTKPVFENSQAAVNNMMFDFMQSRLEDESLEAAKERYTPGGFANFTKAKNKMLAIRYGGEEFWKVVESKMKTDGISIEKAFEEAAKSYEKPNYDPTELSTIAHYQTWNALYDKLIGMAANYSINQRLTPLMKEYKLKERVRFGSMLVIETNDKTKDKTANETVGLSVKERTINGQDTELNVTEMLAASVDAVKDALLEFFGIDDTSFNMACFMAKIGASPTDIGLLLNQPVVQEALQAMKTDDKIYNLSEALESAFKKLFNADYSEYKKKQDSLDISTNLEAREAQLTTEHLLQNIKEFSATKQGEVIANDDVMKSLFAVVECIKDLQNKAESFSEQVSVTHSTSTNSVDSSCAGIIAMIQKVKQVQTNMADVNNYEFNLEVKNGLHYVIDPYQTIPLDPNDFFEATMDSPFMMEQAAYSTMLSYVTEVLSAVFPYFTEGYTTMYDSLAALTKRKYLTKEMIDDVIKDFPQYALGVVVDKFNSNYSENTIYTEVNGNMTEVKVSEVFPGITNRDFYNYIFPEIFLTTLARNKAQLEKNENSDVEDYSKIPLIAAIIEEAKAAKSDFNTIHIPGIGSLQRIQKEVLRDSWKHMYNSEDKVLRDLAKHLFMYSYFQAGLTFSPLSLSSLVSTQIKMQEHEYLNFFNKMFDWILETSEENGDLLVLPADTLDRKTIPVKDLLKNFILNHYKQYRQFTRWLYPTQSTYKKIVNGTQDTAALLDESTKSFTIKASDFPNLVTKITTKTEDGKDATLYEYVPAIVLSNGKEYRVFICDNEGNDMHFNSTTNEKITYYEMEQSSSYKDYSSPKKVDTAKINQDSALIKAIHEEKARRYALYGGDPLKSQPDSDSSVGKKQVSSPISADMAKINYIRDNLKINLKSVPELRAQVDTIVDLILKGDNHYLEKIETLKNQIQLQDIKKRSESLTLLNSLNTTAQVLEYDKFNWNNLLEKKNEKLKNAAYRLNAVFQTLSERVAYGKINGVKATTSVNTLARLLAKIDKETFGKVPEINKTIGKRFGDTFDDISKKYFSSSPTNIESLSDLQDNDEYASYFSQADLGSIQNSYESLIEAMHEKYGDDVLYISKEFDLGGYSSKTGESITGKMDMIALALNSAGEVEIHIFDFKVHHGDMSDSTKLQYYIQLELYKSIIQQYFPETKIHTHLLTKKIDSGLKYGNLKFDYKSKTILHGSGIPLIDYINQSNDNFGEHRIFKDVDYWNIDDNSDKDIRKEAVDAVTEAGWDTILINLSNEGLKQDYEEIERKIQEETKNNLEIQNFC